MADSPANAETRDDPAGGSGPASPPRTPRWVKVSGALALVAVVVLVVLLAAGGGQHGPGGHAGGGGQQQQGGQMPGCKEGQMPSGGGAGGRMPPLGGDR